MPTCLRVHSDNLLSEAATRSTHFFSSAQTDTRHRILLHTDTLRRRFDADFINESLVFEVHVRMLGAYARLDLDLTISSSTRSSCESEKKITA